MKKGFTLAEVLITLGVIGIVVTMTMPVLISHYRDKEFVTRLKKVYSVLDNAYHSIIFEEGNASSWDMLPVEYEINSDGNIIEDVYGVKIDKNAYPNSIMVYKLFKPYLKVVKECEKNDHSCFPEEVIEWGSRKICAGSSSICSLYKNGSGARIFIVLEDGISIGFLQNQVIYVDLNGPARPNKVGEDVFQFNLGVNSLTLPNDGNETDGGVICYSNNWTCSAWAIINENLDYLHCNDLNWKSKIRCK